MAAIQAPGELRSLPGSTLQFLTIAFRCFSQLYLIEGSYTIHYDPRLQRTWEKSARACKVKFVLLMKDELKNKRCKSRRMKFLASKVYVSIHQQKQGMSTTDRSGLKLITPRTLTMRLIS
ncbi:hypothetical protein HOLleu_26499 [Holothuria leucospilota]|uniref:Uncharacterized protein n=1 Tax=Holothuria leucospilota TaxID=206669 RepID=A0A9Q1BPF0_HOLLE|nr:hypothetical protein HOLleu_26499 [Holothuria leucospilota]